jgi:hypothetical protein
MSSSARNQDRAENRHTGSLSCAQINRKIELHRFPEPAIRQAGCETAPVRDSTGMLAHLVVQTRRIARLSGGVTIGADRDPPSCSQFSQTVQRLPRPSRGSREDRQARGQSEHLIKSLGSNSIQEGQPTCMISPVDHQVEGRTRGKL